jgi:hypothetical protein
VLGRTGSTSSTSGWIIRIPAGQAPGAPCAYELVQTGIVPYAGLGAAPNSNLLYAVGDNSVLTLQIQPDGSLTTAGSIPVDGFTGAGDITAGPDGKGVCERGRERCGGERRGRAHTPVRPVPPPRPASQTTTPHTTPIHPTPLASLRHFRGRQGGVRGQDRPDVLRAHQRVGAGCED